MSVKATPCTDRSGCNTVCNSFDSSKDVVVVVVVFLAFAINSTLAALH